VLIDKAGFALANLIFVVIGSVVVLWEIELPAALRAVMLAATGLMGVGVVGFLLLQKRGKIGVVVRWLAARKIARSRLEPVAAKVTVVDEAFSVFHRERSLDFRMCVWWHWLAFCVGLLQAWLFFLALGGAVSFLLAASVGFLGLWSDLVAFAVPLSLGTLEGGRIVRVDSWENLTEGGGGFRMVDA